MLTPDEISSIKTQLDVCEDELEKLTDWEKNFIESVSDQFTNRGLLSFKQQEILKKIYDKVV